jgi:ribose 5-phosphate isomerase B
MTRKHNNPIVLALGGRILSKHHAKKIMNKFLTTEFEGGRHLVRLDKMNEIVEKLK